MAMDPRKRQKKLAKQKAKAKAKKKEMSRRSEESIIALVDRGVATVLHSYYDPGIWASGMGTAVFSRELPRGRVAFASFVIDAYCLGVKNAMSGVASKGKYLTDMHQRISADFEPDHRSPEFIVGLVEGAVAYARNLGFTPHADYREAQKIFGEFRATDCDVEFEFGKDGKPLFINGPFDSPARCRSIVQTLERTCGPDGFHFVGIME